MRKTTHALSSCPSLITNYIRRRPIFHLRRSQRVSPAPRPPDVHPLPDPGAGEGVSLQPLPDAAQEDRNRSRAVPDRAADQNMVPEQKDEAQEGAEGSQGN